MRELVLFSRDYYPGYGGVKNYTHHFFQFLLKKNENTVLIALQNPNNEKNIEISHINTERKLNKRWGDSISILRKVNTFIHLLKLRQQSRKEIFEYHIAEKHLLITSLYDLETLLFLDECVKKAISYSIVFHGLDIIWQTSWYNPKWTNIFFKVVSNAQFVIFNSEATKKLFVEKVGIEKKSVIIYPGIHSKQILNLNLKERNNFNVIQFSNEDIVVSSIGALVERKGFDLAIEAMEKVFAEFPDLSIKYAIAGSGKMDAQLRELIKQKKLSGKVFLLGNISDDLKFELLKLSSIFLMPSHTQNGKNIEGFGIVYLEAALMQNYVIGTNTGGAPEAIPKPPQGVVVKAGNIQELQNEIILKIKAIENGDLAKYDQNWLKEFEWEAQVEKFWSFYKEYN